MAVAGDGLIAEARPRGALVLAADSDDGGGGNDDAETDIVVATVRLSDGDDGLLPTPPLPAITADTAHAVDASAVVPNSTERVPSGSISSSLTQHGVGAVPAAGMGGPVQEGRRDVLSGGGEAGAGTVKPPRARVAHACAGGGVGMGRGVPATEEEGEEESSRLNGKSVEAKGSTGVSPMQKRNRRELKVCVCVCMCVVRCVICRCGFLCVQG